jgi:AdoMet-dependent heme synthase
MLSDQPFDFFFQWHLTERCNLKCRHCYQIGNRTAELDFRQVQKVLAEVTDLLRIWGDAYEIAFSSSFNITGGEPLLREDLFLIIDEVGRRGFDSYLLTNGLLIDAEAARRLSTAGVKGVQVSIEGPEDVHESIRGKGSFSAALRGARNLLDAGLVVTLNVTLSVVNAHVIKDLVTIAASEGVQRLGFSRLVPYGRGTELLGMMLDRERVREVYEEIFSMEVEGLEFVTGDPVASQLPRFEKSEEQNDRGDVPLGGCSAGISGLTFLPDGSIVPCRRMPIPIGKLLKDPLREVWATSDVLEGLRDRNRYSGKCRTCARWSVCRGCRAIAYAYSGAKGEADFLAEDPQCFMNSV